jgi:hypothetical protein
VTRSVETILRVYALYEPLRIFLWLAVPPGLAGLILSVRFAWFAFQPGPTGHVQSLVIGGVLLLVSVQLIALGILADLLRGNRVLAERTLQRVRRLELEAGVEPDSLAAFDADERDRATRR